MQKSLVLAEARERAELDQLSSHDKAVLVPPIAFPARAHDMLSTLFEKNDNGSVDDMLDMVQDEEDEFVFTDDSNNLLALTQGSNHTFSSQRSRSATLDSLGTFDTLDSIDMDFLNVTGPIREKESSKRSDSLRRSSKMSDDDVDNGGVTSSVASVYYSFRNSSSACASSDCSGSKSTSSGRYSLWNLQNIGELTGSHRTCVRHCYVIVGDFHVLILVG